MSFVSFLQEKKSSSLRRKEIVPLRNRPLSDHDVHNVLDHNDLAYRLAFEERLNIRRSLCGSLDRSLVGVRGQRDAAAHLAVDLHAVLHGGCDQRALVADGPLAVVQLFGIAERLVHLLGNVRRKGAEELEQRVQLVLCDAALCVNVVHKAHHRGDRRVELHALDVLRNLFDAGVEARAQLGVRVALALDHVRKPPYAIQELPAALRSLGIPRDRLVERAHEHDVQAERVRAVDRDVIVRIDHVAARFRHFLAVRAEHHAVARPLHVRFGRRDKAAVIQELMPEARVEQVQRCVLHAAVVPIYGQPVFQFVIVRKRLVVVRVALAQEIPA